MWWIEGMLSEYYMSWYHSHLMEVVGFDFIYLSEDIWRVWQDLAFFVRMLSHARIERVCCPGQEDGCWLEATRGLGGEVRERWPPHQGRDHLTSDTENQQERIWKNMMERDGTRWNEMERDGTRIRRITSMLWGLQTASYSKYWKSRFSLIHWHDMISLGSAAGEWSW